MISEEEYSGGIAGNFTGSILNSESGVDVEAKVTEAGGFVGRAGINKDGSSSYLFMYDNVTLNTSEITASSRIGGAIGQLSIEFGLLENYISNANITTIVGRSDGTRVAGVVGFALVGKYLGIDNVHYVNDDKGITAVGHIGGLIGKIETPQPQNHVGKVVIDRVHTEGVINKISDVDIAIGGLIGRIMSLKTSSN